MRFDLPAAAEARFRLTSEMLRISPRRPVADSVFQSNIKACLIEKRYNTLSRFAIKIEHTPKEPLCKALGRKQPEHFNIENAETLRRRTPPPAPQAWRNLAAGYSLP
jgi:hypothetical protein